MGVLLILQDNRKQIPQHSSVLLLYHIREVEAAKRVERAVWCAYEEGTSLTPDVGGTASTEVMTDRIVQLITEKI